MPDDRCSIRGRPQPQPRSFDAATVQAGRLIGKMSKSLADDWRMKILKARLVKGTAFFLGQQNLSSLATALPRKSLQPRFSCAHPQLSNIEFVRDQRLGTSTRGGCFHLLNCVGQKDG